ncbi:MAG: HD domain-containing protein [Calditrichaeota bacterium]|nr:HD domain-containing protein [Calditrichota bacterium]MCB0303346.1 HD domain-containing protein [Calditrichota bacterium]
MKTKQTNPHILLSGKSPAPLLEIFFEINHLKQLFRQGWLRHLAPAQCESVAEHTLATVLMAWMLADTLFPELDRERVLMLALLHDIGEIYAGDITPADAVSAGEKHRRESAAVRRIVGKLPRGERYLALWEEYESGATPEARLVKQVDKLEMALQACIYEHQHGLNLQEFLDSAALVLESPELKSLFEQILEVRPPEAGRK